MDNEVTKLYENAGIKGFCKNFFKDLLPETCLKECEEEDYKCEDCKDYYYPPFTAEKQLELIKWLAITRAILIKQNRIFVGFETGNPKDLKCAEDLDLNFEETLAGLINNLWQDLTDTEKAEIKEILK